MLLEFLVLLTLGLANGVFTPSVPNYYFSTAFSPYVDDPWAWWTSPGCPFASIESMLTLVKTQHSNITTYSMGVTPDNYMCAWDDGENMFMNALIARAAATVNSQSKSNTPPLTVIIGVYQLESSPAAQAAEVNNAFTAAADANTIFPGTVNGIVFTNEYVNSNQTGNYVWELLNAAAPIKGSLKIGVRINTCDEINGGDMVQILQQIAQISDFIMCNIYAPEPFNSANVTAAVDSISQRYFKAEAGFKAANSKIEVYIGETGWSSGRQQNFFNLGQYNTAAVLVQFWEAMNVWANKHRVPVFMFEAFDEPWKDRSDQGGALPGETTFGWWYKDNGGSLVAKVTQLPHLS